MTKHYLRPDWPAPANVKAYTTTRHAGFSEPPFHHFNLAQHVGENAAIVAKNREKLITDLQLPAGPVWLNQIHSATALSLDKSIPDQLTADAAYTTQPNRVCIIMTADCLPLLVTNEKGSVVAAIHGGWRGLLNGVIENTVAALNTSPKTLLAWMGPAISATVYEVGPEVRQAFLAQNSLYKSAFQAEDKDRWLADLYEIARLILHKLGVTHIYGGNYCTYQQSTLFYSHRRDQGKTGRMASLIYLAE